MAPHHGHEEEAERIVDQIEAEVREEGGGDVLSAVTRLRQERADADGGGGGPRRDGRTVPDADPEGAGDTGSASSEA